MDIEVSVLYLKEVGNFAMLIYEGRDSYFIPAGNNKVARRAPDKHCPSRHAIQDRHVAAPADHLNFVARLRLT